MDLSLFPFGIVLLISIGASLFASRRENDFFLASRSIRWPMLVGTFVGLHVGDGFILGNTEASWAQGVVGSMYGFGLVLGMVLLGCGFAGKLRSLNVSTLPELLEKRFGSLWLKRAAGLLAVVCLGGILMAQAIGLKKFLVSIGFSQPLIFLTAWGSVVLYTAFGGLLAVVWTDMIQAVLMVAMLAITFCATILPHMSEVIDQAATMGIVWNGMSVASLLFPLGYIFVTQDIAQRCFAAKSPADATKGSFVTALVLLLLTVVPTACGLLGKVLNCFPADGAIFMQVIHRLSSPFVFVMAASAVLLGGYFNRLGCPSRSELQPSHGCDRRRQRQADHVRGGRCGSARASLWRRYYWHDRDMQ